MGRHEVTQAQWRAVAELPKVRIGLNPAPSLFKGDNLPVEQVSWDQAMELECGSAVLFESGSIVSQMFESVL